MTLEELARDIRILKDIEEIKKLQYQYVNNLIVTNWEAIMELFAEDCTLDLGDGSRGSLVFVRGKADISKYFRERVSTAHHGREGNFLVHPIVTVDGDDANGTFVSYFMHIHARTGEPLQWMQGMYDCTYTRENGCWKFKVLKWRSRLKYIESREQFDQIQYEA